MNKKIIGPILLSALMLASCNLISTTKKKPHSHSSTSTVTSTTQDDSSGSSSSHGGTSSGSSSHGGSTSGSSSSSGKTTTTTGTSSSSGGGQVTPVVTSVTLNSHAESVKQGASVTLTATVVGEHNPSKTVTWNSSNSSIATVSNGVVSVKSNATVGATCAITATSTVTPSVSDSCTITVLSSSASESYTILIYMCGSNLESSYVDDPDVEGLASSDLREMASVSGQPSNVNIVVETGGSEEWADNPGIDATKNERRYLRNGQFVVNTTTTHTKANMGLANTLKDFLSWGLKAYPADHTGVIMWNHGGAVSGCCFDDNYGGDGILASEFDEAVKGALSAAGKSGQKLDWIGYDCCIMSYADLASINSQYFKYQVSSQELESGTGWDYDAWLPTLYQNTSVSTETLLTKICDTFVADNDFEGYQGGGKQNNDQTLSVLNLQNMPAFTTAFESFAGGLKNSDWSSIKNAYTTSLRMGYVQEDYWSGYCYGITDMKDFLNKLSSSFDTSAALSALNGVLVNASYRSEYYTGTKPCGLNVFVPADNSSSIDEDEYGENDTKLSNWRDFVIANGSFYSSGGGGWGW